MNTRLLTTLAAAAALLGTALPAAAQDSGNFLVRVRATHLESANGGSTTPDLKLSVNNKWLPELDLSYFFSPNLAAELILTIPQKQTLYSNGTEVGSFYHLPPTLLAQYHFTNVPGVRPYLGAGVNYTNITKGDFAVASSAVSADVNVKRGSWGLAFQAGVDVPIGGGYLFNVDVKKVQIGTDVLANGNSIGKLKIDPTLFSVGIGKRF